MSKQTYDTTEMLSWVGIPFEEIDNQKAGHIIEVHGHYRKATGTVYKLVGALKTLEPGGHRLLGPFEYEKTVTALRNYIGGAGIKLGWKRQPRTSAHNTVAFQNDDGKYMLLVSRKENS